LAGLLEEIDNRPAVPAAGPPRRPLSQPGSRLPAASVDPLSRQEQRVLRLLAAGMSNPEIADELVVSVNTVKTHVKSIYRKLNVNSRRGVRQAARSSGLMF
jgi:LuxR family maltose regulon positive regulatory protein